MGENPKEETDLALSCLMADSLGKTLGEELLIMENGEMHQFYICGIYQDVTSGGRTAKTIHDFAGTEAEKYDFQVDINKIQIEEWRQILGKGYSIEYMEEFIGQTLGGIIAQVQTAVLAAFWIGVALIVLIAALFLKLRLVIEANSFAVKKAIGIPYRNICLQELYPILRAGGIGCFIGILLSFFFGDDVVSMMFCVLGLGIKKIQFVAMPIETCVLIPVVLLLVLTVVTLQECRQIKKIEIARYLNDN